MDTLTISKKLLATGLNQEQSEVIAQAIEQKETGIITKEYLDARLEANTAILFNKLVIAMIAIAGISLTLIKLFFLE